MLSKDEWDGPLRNKVRSRQTPIDTTRSPVPVIGVYIVTKNMTSTSAPKGAPASVLQGHPRVP